MTWTERWRIGSAAPWPRAVWRGEITAPVAAALGEALGAPKCDLNSGHELGAGGASSLGEFAAEITAALATDQPEGRTKTSTSSLGVENV